MYTFQFRSPKVSKTRRCMTVRFMRSRCTDGVKPTRKILIFHHFFRFCIIFDSRFCRISVYTFQFRSSICWCAFTQFCFDFLYCPPTAPKRSAHALRGLAAHLLVAHRGEHLAVRLLRPAAPEADELRRRRLEGAPVLHSVRAQRRALLLPRLRRPNDLKPPRSSTMDVRDSEATKTQFSMNSKSSNV